MRFDLLSLKLFVIVCEQQSISRTADVERIAASAVSKRMSDLEAMVKTPLFLRSQKGLDMTPAAHDLLRHARIVLRDLGQLENDMLDHSKGRRGDVRLHACHSPIAQHLPDDLANFLALNPAIRVSIDEGLSRNVVQAVSENAADIGVFGGGTTTASLHVTPYRTDRLVVIMPAEHRAGRRRDHQLRRNGGARHCRSAARQLSRPADDPRRCGARPPAPDAHPSEWL